VRRHHRTATVRERAPMISYLVVAAVALAAPAISPQSSRSAQEKFDRLGNLEAPSGSQISFTQDEINSYLQYDFASEIPAGVSDPFIRLERDRVAGRALVDFNEWQAAKGEQPNPLLAWMLRGQRRVDVVCRYTSANGMGQVDVESVRIGDVSIAPSLVTFLIENVVQPRYPAAVVGRPVPIGHNLRQVRLEPGRAVAVVQ
jgi:hypothetical protein